MLPALLLFAFFYHLLVKLVRFLKIGSGTSNSKRPRPPAVYDTNIPGSDDVLITVLLFKQGTNMKMYFLLEELQI